VCGKTTVDGPLRGAGQSGMGLFVLSGLSTASRAASFTKRESSPERSNSAILSRISRRDRHMKLAISSTGSFSLMQLARFQKIDLRPFRASVEVGPIVDVVCHFPRTRRHWLTASSVGHAA